MIGLPGAAIGGLHSYGKQRRPCRPDSGPTDRSDSGSGRLVAMSSGLVAEVRLACRERLADAGFQPRSGDIFTRPIANDLLWWLGLNRAVGQGRGAVEVNPVVGVRHQVLETSVAELLRVKPHSYIPPTLSISLGYLMPNPTYRPWIFDREVPVAVVADSLVEAVVTYGSVYAEMHGSLVEIIESMVRGEGIRELTAYRLPVGYLLSGRPKFATASLNKAETEIGAREDPAAQQFRGFAAEFRKRLEISR